MSSLLRNGIVDAASLNRFSDERNAHDRTNHVRRAHHMLYMRTRHILLFGRVEFCKRHPDVTFEVAKHQGDRILSSAQGEPTSSLRFCVVPKQHRQAVNGNEGTADTRYSEKI